MKKIKFEIDSKETDKIIKVIKALGGKNIRIKSVDYLLSKEEFYAKIDESILQAKEGRTRVITPEEQRTMLGLEN